MLEEEATRLRAFGKVAKSTTAQEKSLEAKRSQVDPRTPLVDSTNVLELLATAAVTMAEERPQQRPTLQSRQRDDDAAGILRALANVSHQASAKLALVHNLRAQQCSTTPPHVPPVNADAVGEYIDRMQKVHQLREESVCRLAEYLRDYQTGKIWRDVLVAAVQDLFQDCPDLIRDFLDFLAARTLGEDVDAEDDAPDEVIIDDKNDEVDVAQDPTLAASATPPRHPDTTSTDKTIVTAASSLVGEQIIGWTVRGKAADVDAATANKLATIAQTGIFPTGAFPCRVYA